MIYKEKVGDLFSASEENYFVHCISDDYALAGGIAVEFNNRFDMRNKLNAARRSHPAFSQTNGHCIPIDKVLNLVTKQWCWEQPTYDSLINALLDMRRICREKNITSIAMPLIGCGIDGRNWTVVSALVKGVFAETDVNITVYRLETECTNG